MDTECIVPLNISRLREMLRNVCVAKNIEISRKTNLIKMAPYITNMYVVAKCEDGVAAAVDIHLFEKQPEKVVSTRDAVTVINGLSTIGWIGMNAEDIVTNLSLPGYRDTIKILSRAYFTMQDSFTIGHVTFTIRWYIDKNKSDITHSKFLSNSKKDIRSVANIWAGNSYFLTPEGVCGRCGGDKFTITYVPTKALCKWNNETESWDIIEPIYDPDTTNGNHHDKIHCAKCKTYHQAAPAGLPGLAVVADRKLLNSAKIMCLS